MNEVLQHSSAAEVGINLSDAAKHHILSYLSKHSQKGIRLSVKKTGCSGLSYVIDYVQTPAEKDVVFSITENFILCIDKASYPYLRGMHVDYVKQGLNHKFVFDNPNQTGACGCGESFTVS